MISLAYIRSKGLFHPLLVLKDAEHKDSLLGTAPIATVSDPLASQSTHLHARLDDSTRQAREHATGHYRALQMRLAVGVVTDAMIAPLVFVSPVTAFLVSYIGGSSIVKYFWSLIPFVSRVLKGELRQPLNKVRGILFVEKRTRG